MRERNPTDTRRDTRRSKDGGWRVEREHGRREDVRHHLDISEFLDALEEVRAESATDLAGAGEQALKILDRFLATLALALGASNERMGMGEAMSWLGQIAGPPREIAQQAELYRDSRNALAHNPDIMLRPEAATRIINGIENLIRTAAQEASDLTRSAIVTCARSEPVTHARDRMLKHRYHQLVVVDERGGALDVLTDRDIVVWDARSARDDLTVGALVEKRGYLAAAFLPRQALLDDAIDALQDDRVVAVILTEHGKSGQRPLGILTRGDLLRAQV